MTLNRLLTSKKTGRFSANLAFFFLPISRKRPPDWGGFLGDYYEKEKF
jgi:hypothetical protein